MNKVSQCGQEDTGINHQFKVTTNMHTKFMVSKWIALWLVIGFVTSNQPIWAQNQNSKADASQSGVGGSAGLTLPLAIEIALQTNPMVRAAHSGKAMASAQLNEAKAGRMPLIQLGETFTNSNNPVFVFGSLLEQGRFGPENFSVNSLNSPDPLTNFRTAVNLKLPVFDQRQTSIRIQQTRIGVEQTNDQIREIEQRLRFEVIQAYYGVLVAESNQKVAADAVHSAEADAKRLNDLFEAGVVVASDMLALETQLAEFRQQQIQAEGNVVTAYAALNTVLGVDVTTPQTIQGDLTDRIFQPASQNELIQTALKSRPDYHQTMLSLEQREKARQGARGQYLPRADIFASYGNSGNKLFNGSADYTVGVSVTFNLFDAGRGARVQQADLAREMADFQQQQKANEIRLEVVRACQNFLAAQERLKVATKAVSQAAEVLRIVRDRYGVGLTTITEVLRAQTAHVRAQTNVLLARYDYYVNFARIQLASGQLVDVTPFTN